MKHCKNCKHLSISDYIFKDETRSVSCSFHKKFFCFINKDVQRKDIKLKDKCKKTIATHICIKYKFRPNI